MIVYDAHSHIGIDSFHPLEGRIGDYFSIAKRNRVVVANIMSVPSPVYRIGGIEKQSLFWEASGNTFSYYSRENVGGKWIKKSQNPINPYREYNNFLEDSLRGIVQPNLKFVPLIHPLLDTPEHLEEVVSQNPVAIKIHGIACGIIPEEVPPHILKIIGKSGIPVIVHTDNAPPSFNGPINYLRRCNRAINWIRLFEEKEVRGYIVHGAYLCSESFKHLNQSSQFLLGIGPELLIETQEEHLLQKKPFLKTVIQNVDINKIAFDIDYPWNINSLDHLEIDTSPVQRLFNLGLRQKDLEKVLYFNAKRYFS